MKRDVTPACFWTWDLCISDDVKKFRKFREDENAGAFMPFTHSTCRSGTGRLI